jgi:hypothetical protein
MLLTENLANEGEGGQDEVKIPIHYHHHFSYRAGMFSLYGSQSAW